MHAPSHQSSGAAAASNPKHGADHIAPDCAGQNFYAIDRGLRDLLRLYLQPHDFSRLEPHFDRLGRLSGGRLDELARAADKHPPVLQARDRFGRDEDWIVPLGYAAERARKGKARAQLARRLQGYRGVDRSAAPADALAGTVAGEGEPGDAAPRVDVPVDDVDPSRGVHGR